MSSNQAITSLLRQSEYSLELSSSWLCQKTYIFFPLSLPFRAIMSSLVLVSCSRGLDLFSAWKTSSGIRQSLGSITYTCHPVLCNDFTVNHFPYRLNGRNSELNKGEILISQFGVSTAISKKYPINFHIYVYVNIGIVY